MKKMLLAGMAAVMVFQVSIAEAAITKTALRQSVERDAKEAGKKGAIVGLNETTPETAKNSAADLLVGLANGKALASEMRTAISRKVSVKDGDSTITLDLTQVARQVVKVGQNLREVNRNNLSAKEKEELAALEDLVQVASQFLALASKSASIKQTLDAETQLQVDAFNRTLSLIPEMLTTMDAREIKSHVEIMRAAVDAKLTNGPMMKGEAAFAIALKAKYGDKAKEKMDEILGCVRG